MIKSIKRVFIANRGEIVRRIASTAQLLGIETVCLSTYPPPNFLVDCIHEFIFVEEESVSLFLDQQALIRWAKEAHCDSIHPGYGFLSENASFAKLVVESGLVWVGPSADVINCMASKSRARKLAEPLVVQSWNDVQKNIGKFNNYFKGNFIIIDNNDAKEDVFTQVFKRVKSLANKRIQNKRAQQWIDNELKMRNITKFKKITA